jgi:hypothetical protein
MIFAASKSLLALYPVDPKKSTNCDMVIFFEISGGSIFLPVKECALFTY